MVKFRSDALNVRCLCNKYKNLVRLEVPYLLLALRDDIEREGGECFALFANRLRLILADVVRVAFDDLERVSFTLLCESVLGDTLADGFAVLQPVDLQWFIFGLGDERAGLALGERGGDRECFEHGRLGLLVGHQHVEGATAKRLAGVVERLAGVRAGVLREDLGDAQFVNVRLIGVLEVFAGFDLFVVVQPDYVEFVTADDSAGELYRFTVLHEC